MAARARTVEQASPRVAKIDRDLSKVSPWLFPTERGRSADFDPIEAGYFGFVYEIVYIGPAQTDSDLEPGVSYIGRTYLRKKINGKYKAAYQGYWGSSKQLKLLIARYGKAMFVRRVVCLCKTKAETNFEETRMQFVFDVLRARLPSGRRKYINVSIMNRFFAKD